MGSKVAARVFLAFILAAGMVIITPAQVHAKEAKTSEQVLGSVAPLVAPLASALPLSGQVVLPKENGAEPTNVQVAKPTGEQAAEIASEQPAEPANEQVAEPEVPEVPEVPVPQQQAPQLPDTPKEPDPEESSPEEPQPPLPDDGQFSIPIDDINALSDEELILRAQEFIQSQEILAWLDENRAEVLADPQQLAYAAANLRNLYNIENGLPPLPPLGASIDGTDVGGGFSAMGEGSNGQLYDGFFPEGDYSNGVGVYPREAGKILVTNDWAAGLVATGHAALVADASRAWSSFPWFASPKYYGEAVEGVQLEFNDWDNPNRHSTCFGLTVNGVTKAQEEATVAWCSRQVGKIYNYSFSETSGLFSYYCSQLVWDAYKKNTGINLDTLAYGWMIHPTELIDSLFTSILYRQGSYRTGWQTVNGSRYYIDSAGNPLTGFKQVAINEPNPIANPPLITIKDTFYFGSDGVMRTGFQNINNARYYFGAEGKMSQGWQQIGSYKYHFGTDGKMLQGWQCIDGKYHYFYPNNDGHMATNWLYLNGIWCYLGPDGVMCTGLQYIDGNTYYFGGNGVMRTSWQYINGYWHYFCPGGNAATGWLMSNGSWYYLNNAGQIFQGWHYISGSWYFFYTNNDGRMATSWQYMSNWYYFGEDGKMRTGWQAISGFWYYFWSSGTMATGWQCLLEYDGRYYWFFLRTAGDGRMATNHIQPDSGGNCYLKGDGHAAQGEWVYVYPWGQVRYVDGNYHIA